MFNVTAAKQKITQPSTQSDDTRPVTQSLAKK